MNGLDQSEKETRKKEWPITSNLQGVKTIDVAKKINRDVGVVDLHCDTMPFVVSGKRSLIHRNKEGHVDIPRLKEAGVQFQVFAAVGEWSSSISSMCQQNERFTSFKNLKEESTDRVWAEVYEMLNAFCQQIKANHKQIRLIKTVDDITGICSDNRGLIGAILAVEGGALLDGKLKRLERLYELGVRVLTLTWFDRNKIAYGTGADKPWRGLTSFGFRVLDKMKELGMVVDLSHIAPPGFWDCIQHVEGPVIASHSNCYFLCPHPRNLTDGQILAIARKGGVIGVNFYPPFVGKNADIQGVCDHIDHIVNLAGIHYVAVGSDFDGIDEVPLGLEDVSKIPALTRELLYRGYSQDNLCQILKDNALRVLKASL